jgi:hypothetical protein
MNFSKLAAGRFRSAIFLLILVMFCVPPLVRATDLLKAGTSSPLKIRLNRGFNVPQTKCRVTPPPAQPVAILATEVVVSTQTLTAASPDDEALPASPPHQSPTDLRGPPAALTVS